jgi:hypothetical protein
MVLDLPVFEPVATRRPVAVVQAGTVLPRAPYAAASTPLDGSRESSEVALTSGGDRFAATWDGRRVGLVTTVGGRRERHVSRRHGRADGPQELAVSLTGPFVTAWVREGGTWVARAVVDLDELAGAPDVHDPAWLDALSADGAEHSGAFGQLGLRDVRAVTHADGTAYADGDGRALLTATSAGPGGFRTGHTSVWSLDVATLDLEHRGDLFFRRGDRVLGDHATHLVRDGERWLVATSTWGDFDRRRNPQVRCALATTTADVTVGTHVLEVEPLAVPVDGLASVGTWDPHLVRAGAHDGDGWLVAYVSATRFFSFHPVVAAGPALDRLTLRAADRDRTATEGVTLTQRDGRWWVLASDGRDGPRGRRERYPVLDLDLREHGTVAAAYPTNLPWPTLLELPGHEPLLLGFDGATAGGPLLGYGTHGRLVVQRPRG